MIILVSFEFKVLNPNALIDDSSALSTTRCTYEAGWLLELNNAQKGNADVSGDWSRVSLVCSSLGSGKKKPPPKAGAPKTLLVSVTLFPPREAFFPHPATLTNATGTVPVVGGQSCERHLGDSTTSASMMSSSDGVVVDGSSWEA